jgi:hypothetical protein
MPTSSFWGKSQVVDWMREYHTRMSHVLDIGVGQGTYADLMRSEGLCHHTQWVGIEVWHPYIVQYDLMSKYHVIINQDVRTLDWSRMGRYNVAFVGDILEHMSKAEAVHVMEQVLDHVEIAIVSVPVVYWPQDEHEGNPYEAHVKPDWSHREVYETWPQYIKQGWHVPKSPVGVYWMTR